MSIQYMVMGFEPTSFGTLVSSHKGWKKLGKHFLVFGTIY